MKRREFLQLAGLTSSAAFLLKGFNAFAQAPAAGAKKLTDKDIMKDGMPANIANYCTNPDKKGGNKACPGWKEKPGHCETCQFFNKDNSLTDYKGGKYARCMLLTDPSKPQFVSSKAWCATYSPKA